MAIPRIFTSKSISLPVFLYQKINSTTRQLITAPHLVSIPVSAFIPSPQPEIFPILKTRPPNPIRQERKIPRPGKSLFATSCARRLLTVIIRQIFNCAPMSSNNEIRITKPNDVKSSSVNVEVCVRNPGPMAEVAIRKAAPSMADRITDLDDLITDYTDY